MSENTQSFENHTRWHAPFHFVLSPILLLHLIWSAVRLVQDPNLDRAETLILSVGLLLMLFLVRINPLKAQDRLIRLEEQLRIQRLLPPDQAKRAIELPVRFLVALRFASDAELPGLIDQALNGKFQKPAEIKRAIKNWRGDYFRV